MADPDMAGRCAGGCADHEAADVHRLVGQAHERHGSLAELPWPAIVEAVLAWQPRRRRAAPRS